MVQLVRVGYSPCLGISLLIILTGRVVAAANCGCIFGLQQLCKNGILN